MRARIAAYLSSVGHDRRFRCVERVGWFRNAFVLPDGAMGNNDGEEILFQSATVTTDLYGAAGTLDGWKEIPALCAGNARLVFALCLAFAGPLLRLTGTEGGGFSLEGESSCGKTTALQVAASVWGGPAHVRTWRATDNGLEGMAALHNDGLLILDEVGQVNGRVLSEVAYMLANGSGKTRAGRDSLLRRSQRWRLLYLSSGEVGLADKLNEVGLRSRAGQETRFVGVPVDREHLAGLHGLPDAGALADRLKALAAAHYGHAGRAFLDWLTRDVDRSRATALPRVDVVTDALLAPFPNAAGCLARDAGLLPDNLDVVEDVKACFTAWIGARGGAGNAEDAAILAQVRLFIEQHGASRFQDLDTAQSTGVINRAGFRRRVGDTTEFLLLPEAFKTDILRGYSLRKAVAVLRAAGWLRCGQTERSTVVRRLPDMGVTRLYALSISDTGNMERAPE